MFYRSGAHFKFTKNFVETPRGRLFLNSLSVSGANSAKEGIIQDFIQAFGTPSQRYPLVYAPKVVLV